MSRNNSVDIPEDFGLGKTYDEIIAELPDIFGVEAAGSSALHELFGFPTVLEEIENYPRVYAVRGHIAAARGDVERLKGFVDEVKVLDSTKLDGIETLMPWVHAAVMGGQPETLKLLLDREASAVAKYRVPSVRSAVMGGQSEMVCYEEAPAAATNENNWAEPIHSLAIAHWTNKWPERFDVILNMLLSHGAKIDACNSQTVAALGLALTKKRFLNVEALLRAGADPSEDVAFIDRFYGVCLNHAVQAREAYVVIGSDYSDAMKNPLPLSKPGEATEEAYHLVRVASLAISNIKDEYFRTSFLEITCCSAFWWPQPNAACALAMVETDPSLLVPALEAVCILLEEKWEKARIISQLHALQGVTTALLEKMNPKEKSELTKRAQRLVATVVPTQRRLVFIRVGSFSLLGIRKALNKHCGLFERRMLELDVRMPLWKLEEVVRGAFPALQGRHVEFFVNDSPLADLAKRSSSLELLKFEDGAIVYVRPVNGAPMEAVGAAM
jgi:hypothetical protein